MTSTDFYPTLLDVAGLPPMPGQHVDGVSLLPLLTGRGTLAREAVYWHYPQPNPDYVPWRLCERDAAQAE